MAGIIEANCPAAHTVPAVVTVHGIRGDTHLPFSIGRNRRSIMALVGLLLYMLLKPFSGAFCFG